MKLNLRTIIAVFASFIAIITLAIGGFMVGISIGAIVQKDAVYASEVRYIAHRGLSSLYYQNTAEAFVAAGQSEFFYGIETDVWQTKDGIWVCCHDKNPFNDPLIKITDIDYEQAISTPLSAAKAGEGIITETERYICDYATYLSICKDYGKTPVIEIKYKASQEDVLSLLEATAEYTDIASVQYITFQKEVADMLIAYDSKLTVQWLINKKGFAYYGANRGYHLGLSKDTVNSVIIKTLHSKKSYVNVWTVNDKEEALRLAQMGVDFITTDFIF